MIRGLPSDVDYTEAIRSRRRTLRVADLAAAPFARNDADTWLLAIPGENAVVCRAETAGGPTAVRFFTFMDDDTRARYQILARFLPHAGLEKWLTPPVWVDEAIEVRGRLWPLVRMPWVPGRTLEAYVEHCVMTGDQAALGRLTVAWREMVVALQAAGFAHGDLQHGNVLVDDGGGVHLIDFDGVWVPGMAGLAAPREDGHRNYQRSGKQWDRWMDTFPALVVYLSLTLAARQPNIWHDLHTSESIVFGKDDFVLPLDTTVWRYIAALDDPGITRLSDELRACCARDWPAQADLNTLLLTERTFDWPGKRATGPQAVRPLPPLPPPLAVPPPAPPAPPQQPAPPVLRPGPPAAMWWQDGPQPARPSYPPPVPAARGSGGAAALILGVTAVFVVLMFVIGQPLLSLIAVFPIAVAIGVARRK